MGDKGTIMKHICTIVVVVLSTLRATPDIAQSADGINTYLVPEFYHYLPQYVRDTALIFRCYDKHGTMLNDVRDYEQVSYFSLFKEYIDSFHTYKDADRTDKLLPVSYIIRRYDRQGNNKWMSIQYPGNKYAEFKSDRSTIVRTDTIKTGDTIRVFRCYKLLPVQD